MSAPLEIGEPDDIANRIRAAGATEMAEIVEAAARSYRSIDAESLHAEHNRLLERADLGAETAEGGSGFGGTPEEWRAAREPITDAIDRDGTFLDVGCANGLLMESVHTWCAERGLNVEPYGLDVAAGLVARVESGSRNGRTASGSATCPRGHTPTERGSTSSTRCSTRCRVGAGRS